MPKGVYSRLSAEERFWLRVEKTPEGCWLWKESFDKDGYGRFNEHRKGVRAHHFSFTLHTGIEIPPGKILRHTCDVRRCVHPDHLILGTQKENIEDAILRGRHVRGETHGMTSLTVEIVKDVKQRLAQLQPMTEISKATGVGYSTVFDIKRKRTWTHV